jgi:hypothetical protein
MCKPFGHVIMYGFLKHVGCLNIKIMYKHDGINKVS